MWVEAGIELQAFACGGRAVALDDLMHQFQWRELAHLQDQLASLDLRHIKYIADQLQEGRRRAFDGMQIVFLLGVEAGT
ncbi:hypothetical protein D3C78_1881630 [compost metagenome]